MDAFAANDLFAWVLIAGGLTYWLFTNWMSNGAAIVAAGLAALVTKSALMDLV